MDFLAQDLRFILTRRLSLQVMCTAEITVIGVKVVVWRAVSVWRMIGPMLFHEAINSKHYEKLILSADGENHADILCKDATAHTADNSVNALDDVFCERLWLLRSLDLNPCDFYLRDMLKK
jgi:hypothetical protein